MEVEVKVKVKVEGKFFFLKQWKMNEWKVN